MSREEACQHFGVQDNEKNRAQTLSELCRRMEEEERRSGLPHCLLVDELPPLTGDTFSSSDWSGADTRGLRLVLAAQPTTNTTTSSSVTPVPPPGLTLLTLERVFRCTQRILLLLTHILQQLESSSTPYGKPSFPLADAGPGHEIPGDLPELLLLPRCSCTSCFTPLRCLYSPHWPTLLAVLTRLHEEGVGMQDTVLMLNPVDQEAKCRAWVEGEVAGQPHLRGLRVKTAPEFRGSEAEVVVWCSGGSLNTTTTLDTCTRATSRLLLICQPYSDGGSFHRALESALQAGLATPAREQATLPPTL